MTENPAARPALILVADDDEEDRMLIRKGLERGRLYNPIREVSDGEELLDYLKQRGPYAEPGAAPRPSLILLDLNMPGMSGREALQKIKADPEFRRIPVIVLTVSEVDADIEASYAGRANAYVTKPVDLADLAGVISRLGEFWLKIVKLPGGEERGGSRA